MRLITLHGAPDSTTFPSFRLGVPYPLVDLIPLRVHGCPPMSITFASSLDAPHSTSPVSMIC